jgi:hypothetical protein
MDTRSCAFPMWFSFGALLASCSGQQTYDDGTDALGSNKARREKPQPITISADDAGMGVTEAAGSEANEDAEALLTPNPREFDVDAELSDVAFADGRFVAVGGRWSTGGETSQSRIYTSVNGQDWDLAQTGTSGYVRSVAYGAGVWVGLAYDYQQDTATVLTSPDGVTWTASSSVVRSDSSADQGQVVFSGSNFLIKMENQVLRSTDGQDWVELAISAPELYRLATTDSGIFGLASEGIYFSDSQGDSWSLQAVPQYVAIPHVWQTPDGVVGAGEQICCFGEIPELNRFYEVRLGTDGVWTGTELDRDSFHPAKPVVMDDLNVAVGRTQDLGYRDADDATWTRVPHEELGNNSIANVAAGNGVFVAAGGGALRGSTDGKEWHPAHVVE